METQTAKNVSDAAMFDTDGRPYCDCPPGYVFVAPNNRFSGCKRNYLQGCGGGEDGRSKNAEEFYEIREFDNVNWPLGDYERLAPYNRTQWEKSCLHDCSCAVAIYDGTRCWKKKLPLSNGRTENIGYTKVLLKVRKGDVPGFVDNAHTKKAIPILLGALLLGGFNFLLLVAVSLIGLHVVQDEKWK
ncbi:G-type lectin S-receptor-like serine/threonine-protein kinase [Melia azedarach]|uniref:G-type lectin S-receptor-like serine/threonine-protein kinase n=1 Tax=Melia azedarach TaxID=155640 RepID=A0ACC1XP78_MELAZ|nr:G-type lectin S-receptor-like serine/threonine-protein kinase [Melia azedarach]